MSLPRLCIPSYKRSETIKNKTLKFLKDSKYPSELIYIFVASEEELLLYQNSCPGYNIIVGVPVLVNQRNFICDWLCEGEIYISMDDDITNIKTLGKSLLDIVRDGVSAIESNKTGLFGILPKDDGRCLKEVTTTHLSFIIGCFFIARNHWGTRIESSNKHDYELSCLYFLKYGTVYRYNGAGVQTAYQKNSGGLQEANREIRQQIDVDYLLNKYPTLCSTRMKNGTRDIQLRWTAKYPNRIDGTQSA